LGRVKERHTISFPDYVRGGGDGKDKGMLTRQENLSGGRSYEGAGWGRT